MNIALHHFRLIDTISKDGTLTKAAATLHIKESAISHQLIDSARVNRYVAPSFQILFGLVFLGFGAYQTTTNGFRSGDVLLYAMGGVFFIYGLYLLVRAVRIGRLTR